MQRPKCRIILTLVLRLWNAPSVSWFGNIAEGRKGGLFALWNQSKFEVANIEYGHGWVALFGAHKASGFRCVAVGIYAPCCTRERRWLWRELCLLKHAFEDPWFLIGDFNETLKLL
nr:uncharacterized protein LOC118046164 [Populus alba]